MFHPSLLPCLAALAGAGAIACTSNHDVLRPWVVSMAAVGPVRFGMTPVEAAAALRVPPPAALPEGGCRYWIPAGAPAGLSLMIENGRVVRVDVDSAGVETAQGLEVGSPVSAVRSALGSSMTDQPHKYQWAAGWRYLTVRSADSVLGLVFEVDSTRVQRFRAGRWPEVGQVERCG